MSDFKASNAHDVFWLASYANRTIGPIIDEIKTIEPTAALDITLTLGSVRYKDPWHITIAAHWDRRGMITQQICLSTTQQVDKAAEAVRRILEEISTRVSA